MAILKVSGISKKGAGKFRLRDISFTQRGRQRIAVIGETGSGKSTLLKIIAGLVQADSGKVEFNQKYVQGPAETLVPGHPGIGYVSQDFELPKFLRVDQVLDYANAVSKAYAETLFSVCRIAHLLDRRTDSLSGGERQRIALARVLISSPSLILLDEPFSNLDGVHKGILKDVIEDVINRLKISCILISHEPADILPWADKILILKGGKLVQKGSPLKVYKTPVNEYAAGLLGSFSMLNNSSKLLKRKGRGKKISRKKFFRPEDFELVSSRRKGVPGIVMDVQYFGSHYEASVDCDGSLVAVRTTIDTLTKGDMVYVSLSP
jgi:iron(III) transport system ATP-binding protein